MRTIGITCGIALCVMSGCGGDAQDAADSPAADSPAATSAAATTASVEDSIRTLEQVWADAIRMRDSATLERLLAPDYTLATDAVNPHPPVPRAVWMENALRHLRVDSIRMTPADVTVRGDTAIAMLRFHWAGQFMREPAFRDSSDLVDTWVRGPDGWRVHRRVTMQ